MSKVLKFIEFCFFFSHVNLLRVSWSIAIVSREQESREFDVYSRAQTVRRMCKFVVAVASGRKHMEEERVSSVVGNFNVVRHV